MEIWGKGLDILDSFLISPWKHPQVGTGSWRTCRWQGPPRLFQVRSCIPRRGPSRCSSSTRRRLRGSGSSCWSRGFLEGATQLLYTGQNIVQTKVSAATLAALWDWTVQEKIWFALFLDLKSILFPLARVTIWHPRQKPDVPDDFLSAGPRVQNKCRFAGDGKVLEYKPAWHTEGATDLDFVLHIFSPTCSMKFILYFWLNVQLNKWTP